MTNAINVTNLDNQRLIREGEVAVDLYNKDIRSARTRIMPMARGLAAAKREYPATQEFGDWLQTSSYRELGPNDRAALIKIGKNEEFATSFMRTTSLTSPELIWDAIAELMALSPTPQDSTSDDLNSDVPAPIAAKAQSIPEVAANPSTETRPIADSPKLATAAPTTESIHLRGWLRDCPRGQEVHEIITHKDARVVLGKAIRERGGKEIWSLILLAIDHGFLTSTDMAFSKITARILFPNAPRSWATKLDLTDSKTRVHLRDAIMPAAIANRDAILKAPERIEQILAAHAIEVRKAEVARRDAEALAKSKQQMLPSEHEVIVFGERMWPAINATYDYDQLRAAIWTFRDLNNWLSASRDGANAGSRAIILRLTTKWYSEYADRALKTEDRAKIKKIFGLIDLLTRLLLKNPDGECKWPPTPVAEGKW